MNRLLPLLLLLSIASSSSFAGEGEAVVLVGSDYHRETPIVTILAHVSDDRLSLGPAAFYGEIGLQIGHGHTVLAHVGLEIPVVNGSSDWVLRPFTGAAWSGSDQINDGAHWNFASGLELECRGHRLRWTHLSHADLGPGDNPGFDAIMYGMGIRF